MLWLAKATLGANTSLLWSALGAYELYKIAQKELDIEAEKKNCSVPHQRANLTTPPGFSIKSSSLPGAGMGAMARTFVLKFTILGVYEGLIHTVDKKDEFYSWQEYAHMSHLIRYARSCSIYEQCLKREVDLNGSFAFRANVLTFDDNESLIFDNWTPVTYQNWNPNDEGETAVDPIFGLLLTYHNDGRWRWVTYYTGEDGLVLPFICEDSPFHL
ncbi:uncharacterized protein LOC134276439 [Saccostrea cucullata]|uniref:uncharacterized protein LOC134276439 n=1 Tax=Saccostrea cuccullata TaxID=36930 RepID=UPI002ECFE601